MPPTESDAKSSYLDFPASNLWFVGVFGGWWRGGPLYSWWVDVVVRSKDEEGVSAGVLNTKSLDNLDEYDGVYVALPIRTDPHLYQSFLSYLSRHSRQKKPVVRHPGFGTREMNYPMASRESYPLVVPHPLRCLQLPRYRFITFSNQLVYRYHSHFSIHRLPTLSSRRPRLFRRVLTNHP